MAKVESFSFLYLNPPYDSEIGSMDNKRMEFLFLEHTYRWLVEGGVLLMVVPQGRLDSCIPLLAEKFADLRTSASDRGLNLPSCQWKRGTDLYPSPRAGH
jgi:16S rRNA G1207 methylase RsmC